jgi:hypothetical protein
MIQLTLYVTAGFLERLHRYLLRFYDVASLSASGRGGDVHLVIELAQVQLSVLDGQVISFCFSENWINGYQVSQC